MRKERIYRNKHLLIFSILMLLGIAIFFLLININTPMMGEDFALISFYPYNEPASLNEHINFIIKRIIAQATGWNIRVGEQISIIFGSIDKIYFYIGNTIISILYVLLIPMYAFGRKLKLTKRDDIISIAMSFCLIILFQPVLGEIFFWRTGSGNYLWAVFILLVFTIPLRMTFSNRDIFRGRKMLIVLHTLLGLFAGLTNENTVITFIVVYLVIVIFKIIKKREIYAWMWSSFTSLVIGFLIMIFAPSTTIRMNTYKKIFGIENVTIKDYIHRAISVIYSFFTENAYLVGILLAILLVYAIVNYNKIKDEIRRKEINNYRTAGINIIFLLMSSLSAGALIGAPYIETRAFFLIDFFLMGCIIYFGIQLINEANKYIKITAYMLLAVTLVFTVKEDIKIYNTYNDYNKFVISNYNIIKEAKNNNQDSVMISAYSYANDRILNTREDYLQSNLQYLKGYFGIKVFYSISEMSLVDEKQLQPQYINLMNGIDYKEYKKDENKVKIIGWAAIENQESKDKDISILLKSGEKIYKFGVKKNERKDVSEYYHSRYYDNTGFYLEIPNADNVIEKGKYTLGICIKDNNNTNYVMYTKDEIEIN